MGKQKKHLLSHDNQKINMIGCFFLSIQERMKLLVDFKPTCSMSKQFFLPNNLLFVEIICCLSKWLIVFGYNLLFVDITCYLSKVLTVCENYLLFVKITYLFKLYLLFVEITYFRCRAVLRRSRNFSSIEAATRGVFLWILWNF